MEKNIIAPFWSWNDKLEINELKRQITLMKKSGIEGFFMHARGGLETDYMSDDWFNSIKACIINHRVKCIMWVRVPLQTDMAGQTINRSLLGQMITALLSLELKNN